MCSSDLTGVTLAKSKDVSAKESSVEDLYAAEKTVLATQRIIPLFHLPVSYATATDVTDFRVRADGSWDVSNAWLGNASLPSLGGHGR